MSAAREDKINQGLCSSHVVPEKTRKCSSSEPNINYEQLESTLSCQTCETCSRGSKCSLISECSRDFTCEGHDVCERPSFHPSYALLQTYGYKAPDSDDSDEELEGVFDFGRDIQEQNDSEETLKGSSHEDLGGNNFDEGKACRCNKKLHQVNQ